MNRFAEQNNFHIFIANDRGNEVKITFDNGIVNFFENGRKNNNDDKPLRTSLPATKQSASKLYFEYVRMVEITFTQTM